MVCLKLDWWYLWNCTKTNLTVEGVSHIITAYRLSRPLGSSTLPQPQYLKICRSKSSPISLGICRVLSCLIQLATYCFILCLNILFFQTYFFVFIFLLHFLMFFLDLTLLLWMDLSYGGGGLQLLMMWHHVATLFLCTLGVCPFIASSLMFFKKLLMKVLKQAFFLKIF